MVALLAVRSRLPSAAKPTVANLSINQKLDDFFKAYWQRPIPLQGPAPSSFTDTEASLAPEACGSCHARQYADWKESLHSRAMGPGPWGQIVDLTQNSPEEAIQCLTCHAPLSEQNPLVATAGNGAQGSYGKNAHFDPQLQLRGITCAACHVRQHQRFGPPKDGDADAAKYPTSMPNHGGVLRTPYFEKAEFCKDCHQFDPDETVLVNGKPLQDTFREWKNSIWGRDEAACQDCHMPGRRHLWRGIHDNEWVKGALRIDAAMVQDSASSHEGLNVRVEVNSAAVGHKFPTYLTPKVFVRAALLDGAGRAIPGTEQERIIGWDVRFENGAWKEYFDTRMPPGGKFEELFRWKASAKAKRIRAWIEVHPDHFYHNHFYPSYLQDQSISPEGRKLIQKALYESGRSSYVLFEKVLELD
jgi:hypothetical protein